MTAVAPADNPSVVVTAMVQGAGANNAGAVVRAVLSYYLSNPRAASPRSSSQS
jgi:cell division protein FtsI/penicillin-binding protein 2